YHHGADWRTPHSRTPPLGRQHDDCSGCDAHAAGISLRSLQETKGGYVDGGRGPSATDACVRAYGVSSAVGQPRVLGNSRDNTNCEPGAARRAICEPVSRRRGIDRRGHVRKVLWPARAATTSGDDVPDCVARLPGAQAWRGAVAWRRSSANEEIL